VLASTVVSLMLSILKPIFHSFLDHWWANAMCVIFSIIAASPFLRPIVMRKNRNVNMLYFWRKNWRTRSIIFFIFILRYFIALAILFQLIVLESPLPFLWNFSMANIAVWLIILSRGLKFMSIRLERTFFLNLHRRELSKQGPIYGRALRGSDLHLTSLVIPENSAWSGKSLASLNIGARTQTTVAAIVRGRLRINIPDGSNRLFPGDVLELVGDDASIETVRFFLQTEVLSPEAMASGHQLTLKKLEIAPHSPLVYQTLANSHIRDKFHCSVIGLEDKDGNLQRMPPHHIFIKGEVIWVIGEYEQIELLRLITHPEFIIKEGEIQFDIE
jgi:CPA2 family monovalent cation:H+ antiporter-2